MHMLKKYLYSNTFIFALFLAYNSMTYVNGFAASRPYQNVNSDTNFFEGTTDSSCDLTDFPAPTEKEIQFILNEVKNYLHPDVEGRCMRLDEEGNIYMWCFMMCIF